jgi:hypothetical protein
MTEQQVREEINLDKKGVENFVKYLGIDYEDYKSLLQDGDIDFDDISI